MPTTRYEQIYDLIEIFKPASIVEVGVHRGSRARGMCKKARLHQEHVQYTGYDVFDTVGMKFQQQALNGKGLPNEKIARDRLEIDGVSFSLVKGDTRQTLHGHSVYADLAFIDGDHRVSTIVGDYGALARCEVVVFDDYYVRDENQLMPDIRQYGANSVVSVLNHLLLPAADPCAHTGKSMLAVVASPEKLDMIVERIPTALYRKAR